MYTLYYKAGACSMAVRVVLEELNVPFKSVDQGASLKDPEFLKLNPRGQIPLLVVDGEPVKEGGALIAYIADTHDSEGRLLPKSGLARAKALEWLMWCNATLHPTTAKLFWIPKLNLDDTAKAAVTQATIAQVQSLWDEADARLATSKFLAGDSMTAADILLAVIANWGVPVTLGSNVKRVLKDVSSRPAYQKALQDEQVTYKAAA